MDIEVVEAIEPFSGFPEAADSVVQMLQARLGFQLWMVTRTEGDDWIVLASQDRGYGVEPGQVFRWSDSYCSRMVDGDGPNIAPDASKLAAYVDAPINGQLTIGAYIGLPLVRGNGDFFGTLCAVDPEPQPVSICEELPLIRHHARLLNTILDLDFSLQELARQKERAEADSKSDALTGLYNRRGWEALIEAEEQRCKRYGNPGGVIVIDLDGLKQVNDEQGHAAGDELIACAGRVLEKAVRTEDVVARLGGDEFAVLAVQADAEKLQIVVERIQGALREAELAASIGSCSRAHEGGFVKAFERADENMYANKRLRKSQS